jgi:hypothetical protein
MIQITRTAFCTRCFEAKRPTKGDMYGLLGRDHPKQLTIGHVTRSIPLLNKGYTPHLFQAKKRGDKLEVTSRCLINLCGHVYKPKEEVGHYEVYEILGVEKVTLMTLREWNSLVLYTDKEYWL